MYHSMEIGGIEIESPLINGGGVVKTVEDVALMCNTGVGGVEVGSYCLEPRIGNSPNGEVVFHHDLNTGLTTNALGMPGQGTKVLADELPEMLELTRSARKPLIVNIAPVSEEPEREIEDILTILDSNPSNYGISAILLNASCPNVPSGDGGRHDLLSYHPDQLINVLRVLDDFRNRSTLFSDLWVRISPFRKHGDAPMLIKACEEVGVDAISAFNTFPVGEEGQEVLDVPRGIGGLSGRAMERRALVQTGWLMDAIHSLDARIQVVGSNGIHDGASMKRRLDLGVSAVTATTIFYEAKYGWKEAVHRPLDQLAKFYNVG